MANEAKDRDSAVPATRSANDAGSLVAKAFDESDLRAHRLVPCPRALGIGRNGGKLMVSL